MKRVILDEGVPARLANYLPDHNVTDVHKQGLDGIKNGKLLAVIEGLGFDAFINNDKRIEFDQNWSRRPFAALLLSTNHWNTIKPNVGKIAAALETARAGEVTRMDVGLFRNAGVLFEP